MTKFLNWVLFSQLMFASVSSASVLVKKDDQNMVLTVMAQMHYYGPEANEQIARAATAEISRMWNEPRATVILGSDLYQVRFEIGYDVFNSDAHLSGSSCAENFIQIRARKRPNEHSFYSEVGSQTGEFLVNDGLGTSTTAAHEFGHAMLLDHGDTRQYKATVPGIMFQRGTFVKQEFCWWDSRINRYTDTLDPKYRKVRFIDVRSIPFHRVSFNSDGYGCLGAGKKYVIPLTNVILD